MRDSLNYSHANLPDFDLTQLIFSPRNKVLCLGSSTGMSVIFFRCIEAMYGTSPDFVEISGSNYCSYYQSMVRVRILVYDLLFRFRFEKRIDNAVELNPIFECYCKYRYLLCGMQRQNG